MEENNTQAADEVAQKDFIRVRTAQDGDTSLTIKNLSLRIPGNGTVLFEDFNLSLKKGDKLVVMGPSGSGKSTLVKAICDKWDDGKGEIILPDGCDTNEIVVMSQKVMLHNTTLRGILNHTPDGQYKYDDKKLAEKLTEVGLQNLIQHIPGQQVQILMDNLLTKIPAVLESYNNAPISEQKFKELEKDICALVAPLVAEQFDYVQHTPAEQREYFRENLSRIVFTHLQENLSDAHQEALSNSVVDEIDRCLTQPLHDFLVGGIHSLAQKFNGKAFPYSDKKVDYFSWHLRRALTKEAGLYLNNKNTDDRHRKININEKQVSYIADTVTDELKREMKENFAPSVNAEPLNEQFNFCSWPVSIFTLCKKAKEASHEIVQGMTVFMQRQVVTGDLLARQLSGGEQQKLMFAQIAVREPELIILDEATAALDMTAGNQLYKELIEKFPDAIVVSIAHNPYIMKYHTHLAYLEDKKVTVQPVTDEVIETAGKRHHGEPPPSPS